MNKILIVIFILKINCSFSQTLVPFYERSNKFSSQGYCFVDSATMEKKLINYKGLFLCSFFNKNGFALIEENETNIVKIINQNGKEYFSIKSSEFNFVSSEIIYNNDKTDFLIYLHIRDKKYTSDPFVSTSVTFRNVFCGASIFQKDNISYIGNYNEGVLSFRINRNGKAKWGFIDVITGKTIVEPIYDEVRNFNQGMAAVKSELGWGYINKDGKEVIKSYCSVLKDFNNDYALASIPNASGMSEDVYLIKNNGTMKKVIISSSKIDWQNNGIMKSKMAMLNHDYVTGNVIMCDKNGVIKYLKFPKYIPKLTFCDSFFIAKYNNSSSLEIYSSEGRLLVKEGFFTKVNNYSDGLFSVEKNGAWGYINYSGKVIIPLQYFSATDFVNSCAIVKSLYGVNIINKLNQQLPIPYSEEGHSDLIFLENGFIETKANGKKVYYDKNGRKYWN